MAGDRQQPGGRTPAPGRLALVQEFVNTHYDLAGDGREILSTPRALGAWLADHALVEAPARASRAELARTLRLREGLRALALANNDSPPGAGARGPLEEAADLLAVRLDPAGPQFSPARAAGVDRALGVLLAVTARAMLDGTWSRLKACPGAHCGWAFYDGSRNRAGRWCSMSVCGGRSKARAYYRRRAGRE